MANKQILNFLKINPNLCEINQEYPLLHINSIDRHLCANTTPLKTTQSVNLNQLFHSTILTPKEEHEEKHSKNKDRETEVIHLFQYEQDEDIHHRNKLYKKCRYQLRHSDQDDDKEQRDNEN